MVEGSGSKRRELEELASLVVLLSQRVERLFELHAALHLHVQQLEGRLTQLRQAVISGHEDDPF